MKSAIEFVDVGECGVNLPLAIKKWTLLCRIVKSKDEYTLVEYTPKGKRKLKVRISKENANYLITELGLKYVSSDVFCNSGTYLNVG